MKKKLFFIGMVAIALVLTGGTFAYTYTTDTATLTANQPGGAWTTYQVSANQPDWNSVLPQGGTASTILVPNAAGDLTDILVQNPNSGEHWDKVDDQPADDGSTYVSTDGSTTWQGDFYQITDLPVVAQTITGVSIFVRYASAGSYNVQAMTEILVDGHIFSGITQSTSGTGWVTISTNYDTNPSTSEAWTADEVNALQAGVTLKGNKKDQPAYCTQVYIQVNYESAGITQGGVPQGFLYNIYPNAQYTGDLLVKVYLTNAADLLKAYQYLNMKVYVSDSLEAGNTPNYKILSIDSGVVEFSIRGGSASQYVISVTGGSYSLVSNDPATWGAGYTLTPELYLEIAQR